MGMRWSRHKAWRTSRQFDARTMTPKREGIPNLRNGWKGDIRLMAAMDRKLPLALGKIFLSYSPSTMLCLCLPNRFADGDFVMALIVQPRRPARAGEWTSGAAILFIVTLAATGSVTLAARAAGMSRKSAYALRDRNPLFAEAWQAARRAAPRPSAGSVDGDMARRAAPSNSSTGGGGTSARHHGRSGAPEWQVRLAAEWPLLRESSQSRAPAALARAPSLP